MSEKTNPKLNWQWVLVVLIMLSVIFEFSYAALDRLNAVSELDHFGRDAQGVLTDCSIFRPPRWIATTKLTYSYSITNEAGQETTLSSGEEVLGEPSMGEHDCQAGYAGTVRYSMRDPHFARFNFRRDDFVWWAGFNGFMALFALVLMVVITVMPQRSKPVAPPPTALDAPSSMILVGILLIPILSVFGLIAASEGARVTGWVLQLMSFVLLLPGIWRVIHDLLLRHNVRRGALFALVTLIQLVIISALSLMMLGV
jgi:hypothetical protein